MDSNFEHVPKTFEHAQAEHDILEKIWSFHVLLSAMYNMRYGFCQFPAFVRTVDLAEIYGALPLLSRTLDGALLRSPALCSAIRQHPASLINIATKIRHAALFKDCLITLLGPHSDPLYLKVCFDRNILNIAQRAYGETRNQVSQLMAYALGEIAEADPMTSSTFDSLKSQFPVHFPHFLREFETAVREGKIEGGITLSKCMQLEQLLSNKLELSREYRRPGSDDTEDSDTFLSARIENRDLPWDLDELEW